MANIQANYDTDAQLITITLNTLGSGSSRESNVVDNTVKLYRDVLVMFKMKNHATLAPTGDKAVYVYCYGTVDAAAPLYPDQVTGADAAITPDSPTHLKPLGSLLFTAAAQTKKAGPWSIAAAFGGRMPEKWGIVVTNATGQTLDVTEANFAKEYQGQKDSII